MTDNQKRNQRIAERLADVYRIVKDKEENELFDKEKYSHWLIVFATAGLTVAIVRSDSLASTSWLGAEHARAVFLFVGVLFLLSAGFGAAIKRIISKTLYHYRLEIVLMLRQSILFEPPDQLIPVGELFDKIQGATFLDPELRKDVMMCRKKGDSLETLIKCLVIVQEVLVAVGYIGIFVCAVQA